MDRREFLSLGAVASIGAVTGCLAPQVRREPVGRPVARPALMKLGCQRFGAGSDSILQFYTRYGVRHIAANPQGGWTAENIRKTRERAASHGISVEAAHISAGNVLQESGPELDRTIDQVCDTIRIGADGGYSILLYGLTVPCGVPSRTEPTPGRGGVSYSTWEFAKVASEPRIPEPVTEEAAWARVAHFLERVVPVAERCKIRLACHPQDPPLPEGFRGAAHPLSTVDGLKRFVSTVESEYHGLHFCQGTISEMLEEPGKDIYDIIRWFGVRKKMFNVHFRNIHGCRGSFYETYPDEGDVDMLKAARVYKEVGYEGMIMPDHLPNHPDDASQREGFAFAYGYIRGLIQAVAEEG